MIPQMIQFDYDQLMILFDLAVAAINDKSTGQALREDCEDIVRSFQCLFSNMQAGDFYTGPFLLIAAKEEPLS